MILFIANFLQSLWALILFTVHVVWHSLFVSNIRCSQRKECDEICHSTLQQQAANKKAIQSLFSSFPLICWRPNGRNRFIKLRFCCLLRSFSCVWLTENVATAWVHSFIICFFNNALDYLFIFHLISSHVLLDSSAIDILTQIWNFLRTNMVGKCSKLMKCSSEFFSHSICHECHVFWVELEWNGLWFEMENKGITLKWSTELNTKYNPWAAYKSTPNSVWIISTKNIDQQIPSK